MDVSIFHADVSRIGEYLEPGSIDAIVTDPPYALTQNKKGGTGVASLNLKSPAGRARIGTGFMGHAWDAALPGVERWAALREIVKPGAWLVAFGAPRKYHRLACEIEDAGWEITDSLMWLFGTGFPKAKSCLKPGYEPIVLARASGPIRELNIDACRIDVSDQKGGSSYANGSSRLVGREHGDGVGFAQRAGDPRDGKGRWPANVVLDGTAAAQLDAQTGTLVSGKVTKTYSAEISTSVALGDKRRNLDPTKVFSDSGGGSRFFYVAKASRSERTHNGQVENDYATVKPLALMSWLIRLVTPPGGVVLDPFMGSGSTLVSCIQQGFDCVGFDREAHAVQITRARVANALAAKT